MQMIVIFTMRFIRRYELVLKSLEIIIPLQRCSTKCFYLKALVRFRYSLGVLRTHSRLFFSFLFFYHFSPCEVPNLKHVQ